ncbi:hypothetical protein L7F22_052498, partial [Adiantum nelumboides]|nr:hypothetical protein [Adiantum nelumboides]
MNLYGGPLLCNVNPCSLFTSTEDQPRLQRVEADRLQHGKEMRSSSRRSPARLPNFLEHAALDLIEVLQRAVFWGIICVTMGAAMIGLRRYDLQQEMEVNPMVDRAAMSMHWELCFQRLVLGVSFIGDGDFGPRPIGIIIAGM